MNDSNEKNAFTDEEIINESDSRFEELLRDKADVKVPESLMPENIYKLLDTAEEKKPEKKKSYKFVYIAVIAAAAVLFIVMGIYLVAEFAPRNAKLLTLGTGKSEDYEKTAGGFDMAMADEEAVAAGEEMYEEDSDSFEPAQEESSDDTLDERTNGNSDQNVKNNTKDKLEIVDNENDNYTYILHTEKGLIEIHKKGIPEEKGLLSTIRIMVYNQGEAFSVSERTSKGKIFLDIVTISEDDMSEKIETYDLSDPKSPVLSE